jgi:regulator of replication initiation timing
MSDQNKYINTYIDIALGTVHDYLNTLLQTKTELRIANDLVSERDQVISALQTELEQEKSYHTELDDARSNAVKWENEVNNLKNSVANFDTLTNQYNTLKQAIIDRDHENSRLKVENEQLKEKLKELSKYEKIAKKEEKKSAVSPVAVPKKDINKETPVVETTPLSMPTPKPVTVTNKVEETDDF